MASRPTTKGRPVTVETIIDRRLKTRWDAASKIILASNREEAEDFDRKWEAVAEVIFSDPPLYLGGGYSSDAAFFEKFLRVDRSTGLRKARVARFATARDIELYGDTKIDAVLDYLEAKTGGPIKSRLPIALADVRVPVAVAGRTLQKKLEDATRDELRKATRALKQKTGAQTRQSPRGEAVLRALARARLKVDVSIHRDTVSLRGIHFSDLMTLGKALAAMKLPASPSPK